METHLQTPDVAHWHALLTYAECRSRLRPSRAQEHYLVAFLLRFARLGAAQQARAAAAVAAALRSGPAAAGEARLLGDRCLFVCGLCPELARPWSLPLDAVVDLGELAYSRAGEAGDALAAELGRGFRSLCALLHTLRELEPGHRLALDPLGAYELLQATGSERAARALRGFTGAGVQLAGPPDAATLH